MLDDDAIVLLDDDPVAGFLDHGAASALLDTLLASLLYLIETRRRRGGLGRALEVGGSRGRCGRNGGCPGWRCCPLRRRGRTSARVDRGLRFWASLSCLLALLRFRNVSLGAWYRRVPGVKAVPPSALQSAPCPEVSAPGPPALECLSFRRAVVLPPFGRSVLAPGTGGNCGTDAWAEPCGLYPARAAPGSPASEDLS